MNTTELDTINKKTIELTGDALDWAVAKCNGYELQYNALLGGQLKEGWCPLRTLYFSEDWSKAGPIIERENIAIRPPGVHRISKERHDFPAEYWRAMINFASDEAAVHGRGETPLIAAMRCYVASKLGETVDIPKVLVPEETTN